MTLKCVFCALLGSMLALISLQGCGQATNPTCELFTTDQVVTKCSITITFNNGNGYLIQSGQIDLTKAVYTVNGNHHQVGANVGLQPSGLANEEFQGCDNLISGTFYSLLEPTCTITITPNNSLQ